MDLLFLDLPDYDLPDELVARYPAPRREDARLLVVGQQTSHRGVADLDGLLHPGDLLVVNDTRVNAARIDARRTTGGRVEVFLLDEDHAMCRPAKKLRAGEVLSVADDASVELLGREGELFRVRCSPCAEELMARHGEMPLPPYLGRPAEPSDRERYQTVYAREPGAVAAPTAGLHLSTSLLARLRERGVETASVTLHVGAGTFRNLRPEDLARGELHPERYVLSEQTVERIQACTGRVVAVGTTVTRVLESAGEVLEPTRGVTRLFLRPGHRFRHVDALLTNFHHPRSSLLLLVCAFGGQERVLSAYGEAIRHAYRFYSYGDAMLLLPGGGPGR